MATASKSLQIIKPLWGKAGIAFSHMAFHTRTDIWDEQYIAKQHAVTGRKETHLDCWGLFFPPDRKREEKGTKSYLDYFHGLQRSAKHLSLSPLKKEADPENPIRSLPWPECFTALLHGADSIPVKHPIASGITLQECIQIGFLEVRE